MSLGGEILKIYKNPSEAEVRQLLKRPTLDASSLEQIVRPLMEDVRDNGDSALKDYTLQFDKVEIENIQVSPEEISEAETLVSNELKQAIAVASSNIRLFHAAQIAEPDEISTQPGVSCWRKSVGIEKVGLYIPGGSAPLFSTVLMLAIPARLAQCKQIVLCTPPNAEGKVHPAILYAASLAGVTAIYKVGGAQAIAAMAYGTATVPQVYKIFGPGNQYVTAAKQLAARAGIAIDMPAGPSEVAVIADETCNPAFVAADLLSQAEHGPDSQVLLITTQYAIAQAVQLQIEYQLSTLPRQTIAQQALLSSRAIVVSDMEAAMQISNQYAPEHLILACNDALAWAERVINAGSVFIGNYTPEAAGDYASGTNHTLPTNGYARAFSGVSLDSFVKKITFQQITKEGIDQLGPVIATMADAEQLAAHQRAVTIRLTENNQKPEAL